MKRVVTHSKPDADAIAAAWLVEVYLFAGEDVEVTFVPRTRPGQPAPGADCVVDVGCVYDSGRLVFDHKRPAFDDRNKTCATRLVWEHLVSLGGPVGHLEALVRVVHEGDRSPPARPSPELGGSRSEGLDSQVKRARARGGGDVQLYRAPGAWLARYERRERAMRGDDGGGRREGTKAGRAGGAFTGAGAGHGDPRAPAPGASSSLG